MIDDIIDIARGIGEFILENFIAIIIICIIISFAITLYPHLHPPKNEFSSNKYGFSFKYPKDWEKVEAKKSDSSSSNLLSIKKSSLGLAYISIIEIDLSSFNRTYAVEKYENSEISSLDDNEIRLMHFMHSFMQLKVDNPKESVLLKFGSTNFAGKDLGEISFLAKVNEGEKVLFRFLSYKSYENFETLAIFIVCPEFLIPILDEDMKYIEQNWQWSN